MESEAGMSEDLHEVDYSPEWIALRIRDPYLQLVDTVLLAELGRTWERVRDIMPSHLQHFKTWSSSPEELRSSRLGQALLTIADCASNGSVPTEKVQRAMKRIYRMLFGDPLTDAYTIPAQFHQTDVGKLIHAAYARMYRFDDLMTAAQAYRELGVARQTLYNRLYKGRLTPIYWHGDLRFLKTEIEVWKVQREQRGSTTKQEE
jgi:hypothetical protein